MGHSSSAPQQPKQPLGWTARATAACSLPHRLQQAVKSACQCQTRSVDFSNWACWVQTYKRAAQAWKGPEGEQVIVDKVLVTNNDEGHMVVKVCRLASLLDNLAEPFPEPTDAREHDDGASASSQYAQATEPGLLACMAAVGDKCSIQHVKRGVVGNIQVQRDLPFSAASILPNQAVLCRRSCDTHGGLSLGTSSAAGTARRA